MRSVFLDFATVSTGADLDPTNLLDALPGLELHDRTADAEVDARIAGAGIVLLNKVQMTRARIEANPALRLVALTATGTNNIDLEAARERGVAVCNIRDYCTASVVQHVFATLLSLTHHLREYDRALKAGAWEREAQFTMLHFPVRELAGRTLGIVGYGTLGGAVARVAEAFGMRVLVANRADAPPTEGRVPLATLLEQVDVLTLHCPITPATRHLIDAAALARMKRDAVLINTARGALVEPVALAAALRAGHAPDLDRLIVTPHTAWAALEARQRSIDELAANVRDFRAGGRRGRVV